MIRSLWIALLLASLGGTQDRPARKVSEYPGHGATPQFEIGAEYLFHSLPTERGALFVGDYIVVEVAINPTKPPVDLEYRNVALRMNGKKMLYSEEPGFVASSIRYPDWETPRGTQAEARVGPVVIGQPTNPGRFPDDPNRTRPPYPPTTNKPDDTASSSQSQPELSVEEYVRRAALPDGEISKPVKGCLFFQYSGMLKSIKSLDLSYDDGKGNKVTLKLL